MPSTKAASGDEPSELERVEVETQNAIRIPRSSSVPPIGGTGLEWLDEAPASLLEGCPPPYLPESNDELERSDEVYTGSEEEELQPVRKTSERIFIVEEVLGTEATYVGQLKEMVEVKKSLSVVVPGPGFGTNC